MVFELSRLVATGTDLVDDGVRNSASVTDEIILSSDRIIQGAFYLLSPQSSPITKALVKSLKRGILVEMSIDSENQKNAGSFESLLNLSSEYNNFCLRIFPNNIHLHAKTIVADRKTGLVSSANSTFSGQYMNYEIGVMVDGRDAWELSKLISRIFDMSVPIEDLR
jgi:phosphatidylserine/phosphatidylglycerophosphate/cardiolipin synthase-like enzyme